MRLEANDPRGYLSSEWAAIVVRSNAMESFPNG